MNDSCRVAATRFASLLWLLVCLTSLAQTSSSNSGIEGVITVSPSQPGPVMVDRPAEAPLAAATFVVKSDKGPDATFTTDDQGRFRISLPAGHYTVAMKERRVRRCGPFEAEVTAGKMTTVQWQCDSGMR